MRIRANDNVMVIRGRDRGKQGRVTRTVTADQKVVVEGVNVVKKHAKRTGNVRQAGIIQRRCRFRPPASCSCVPTASSRPNWEGESWPTGRRPGSASGASR